MKAWILTIGDELLRGEIVDSNKSFFSERLLALDIESERHVTVADDAAAIEEIVREAVRRADVILVSGGLGPTRDDITTAVLARSFGRALVRDADTLDRMQRYFARVGRSMSENNAKQADFPEGAEILPNPLGTAPGFMLEEQGALLFCTPGVPTELYRMVEHEILPRIAGRLTSGTALRATLLRTFGLGESTLDQELGDLAREDPDVSLGFRTQFPDNLVRVRVRAPDAERAQRRLDALVATIGQRLGPLVVEASERPMETVVADLLREHKRTLAVAESCTGGQIASLLTDTPGSSEYFLAGVIAYSNESKQRELGVAADALATHGAVSEPVARQMAEGIRARTGADLALATTGIAGPEGGSEDKPVGTIWIALASPQGCTARRYQLLRDRSRNKRLGAQIALEWVRRTLLGIALPEESFPRMRSSRS